MWGWLVWLDRCVPLYLTQIPLVVDLMVAESNNTSVAFNDKYLSVVIDDPDGFLSPSWITTSVKFSADSNQTEEALDLLVRQFSISLRQMISDAYRAADST